MGLKDPGPGAQGLKDWGPGALGLKADEPQGPEAQGPGAPVGGGGLFYRFL